MANVDEPGPEIDITNWQMVGTNGRDISVTSPKHFMTPDEALVHAAWLVTLADPGLDRFGDVLNAVQAT